MRASEKETSSKAKATASDLVLSFPDEEKAAVCKRIDACSVLLEYGSGGTTMYAARKGKRVFSVESDPNWARDLAAEIAREGHSDHVSIAHVDIGSVGTWGRPKNAEKFETFHQYPLAIWDRPDFEHPDLILIDGRFRVACFLTALMRIKKPVTVLFDDYANRERYLVVEQILAPSERIGRVAVFELTPGTDLSQHLTWVIGSFAKANYVGRRNRK